MTRPNARLDVPSPRPSALPPRRGKESKDDFVRRHVRALESAEAAGTIVVEWQKNDGHHVRLRVVATGVRYDLWPASGRWQAVGSPYKPERGGLPTLLAREDLCGGLG